MGIRINEVLPAPGVIDWDGDGTADEQDEWIELHNAGSIVVDLRGWSLHNVGSANSFYRIRRNTVFQPGAFAVFYRRQTRIALRDHGDELRLLAPDGTLVDSVAFGKLAADASYSRGEEGLWHPDWPPSPHRANMPPELAAGVMLATTIYGPMGSETQ